MLVCAVGRVADWHTQARAEAAEIAFAALLSEKAGRKSEGKGVHRRAWMRFAMVGERKSSTATTANPTDSRRSITTLLG